MTESQGIYKRFYSKSLGESVSELLDRAMARAGVRHCDGFGGRARKAHEELELVLGVGGRPEASVCLAIGAPRF